MLAFDFEHLQLNRDEWKLPHQFLPERFDPNDEMSLTPKGTKRNPYSWVPFHGGRRVCFGKTFADMIIKVFATYASQFFEFRFVSDEYSANKFPMLHAGMTKTIEIKVELKKYDAHEGVDQN